MALDLPMPGTGVEPASKSGQKSTKPTNSAQGGAKSGAPKDKNDSNLAWLTEHWPDIPESTRGQIITLAKSALNPGGHGK